MPLENREVAKLEESTGGNQPEPVQPAVDAGKADKTAGGGAAEKKKQENRVVRLLEKNPLGMTLPEMAGGPRQLKKIRALRPMLTEAIQSGLVMPVSQRAGNTVYRLVKFLKTR